MSRPTCALCSAFSALTKECRRHSPKPIALSQNGEVRIIGAYPGTNPEGWCLDFQGEMVKGEMNS